MNFGEFIRFFSPDLSIKNFLKFKIFKIKKKLINSFNCAFRKHFNVAYISSCRHWSEGNVRTNCVNLFSSLFGFFHPRDTAILWIVINSIAKLRFLHLFWNLFLDIWRHFIQKLFCYVFKGFWRNFSIILMLKLHFWIIFENQALKNQKKNQKFTIF